MIFVFESLGMNKLKVNSLKYIKIRIHVDPFIYVCGEMDTR